MIRATILLHTDDQTGADATLQRVDELLGDVGTVTRTVTAYDGLADVTVGTERGLSTLVGRIQALDGVARTLTLVHTP